MTQIPFHPLANCFPLLGDDELEALAADIRNTKQHQPIMRAPDGSILDGRNRYLACLKAGRAPIFREYKGTVADMPAYVLSINLNRRHLDTSQRAMVASAIATTVWGGDRKSDQTARMRVDRISNATAAKMLSVGLRSVEEASTVRKHGLPELIAAVQQGKVSVTTASIAAKKSKAEQIKVIAIGKTRRTASPKVSAPRTPNDLLKTVQEFHHEGRAFVDGFGPRLTAWVAAHPELDAQARASLHSLIDVCETECGRIHRAIDSLKGIGN